MNKRVKFQPKPVNVAVGLFAGLLASTAVQAGPGFGDAFDLNNNPFIVQSYFASSPAGARQWDPLTGAPAGYDVNNAAAYKNAVNKLYPGGYPGTGKALRKFVDPLPLPAGHALTTLYAKNAPKLADGVTAKYIPVAAPVKWVNPQGQATGDDYYEIAVIEYTDKFHTDLKKATTLRGYIQIDQFATYGLTAPAGWVSKAVPLTYPDGTPIMVAPVNANGKLIAGAAKVQAKAVDNPHYLGPIVGANRNVPTRIKLLNLLPVGRAEQVVGSRLEWNNTTSSWDNVPTQAVKLDAAGKPLRHGDLFLPVDPSIVGAGLGPDGLHNYPQNRTMIHLHGGDNPWISDGTPHQWITPAGEVDPANPLSVAADPTMDPTMIGEFTRGVSAKNVPDMFDPGPGAMTYYYPNGQTARMEWYHDHTVGLTRLNVYAGMASTYMLTDPTEQNLITSGVLPGPEATIPLVLQDKTFVPDDIALQDARWSTTAWGQPGDMWFSHVYETVQDPNQATNFNAVGRWHWGPWFWPSFPSMYALPSGTYGDTTTTPENWMDTSLVNGVAYPTLTVDPKPYRLRILNASSDRTYTFNMYVADPTVTTADGRTNTEVALIPTGSRPVCVDPLRSDATGCFPANWANDPYGHTGGIPDPLFQGPTLMQIASEGGWLPGVATKDPAPISYLLDKGRAAVLNVDYGTSGLHISNAERADLIVDFAPYAGKTLIVYNDSGAPVPAADPRNEYFTGYGDNSATGGAEDTLAGYGPNSRTLMQIVVNSSIVGAPATTANLATIDSAIKAAYKADQEVPIVAQAAYNGVYNLGWTDTQAFGHIYTGSLKEPAFKFQPGSPGVFNSIVVSPNGSGSGYLVPPTVTITPSNGVGSGATADATLKIDKLHVIRGGAGYRIAPTVTIISQAKGSGAGATSRLKVSNVHITNGGSGYTPGTIVTFGKPQGKDGAGNPGVTATGTAVVDATGKITGVTNIMGGSGYTSMPTVSFSGGGTGATGVAYGSVGELVLDVPDPLNPSTAGGGGYDNLLTAAAIPAGSTATAGLLITISPPAAVPATAGFTAATGAGGATGKVFDITLSNVGTGYTAPPQVLVSAPSAADSAVLTAATTTPAAVLTAAAANVDTANGGAASGSILVKTKAIQELFDPTYGRLNATFGVEIPFTSALTQTTIPLGYVDQTTEEFQDGETQIWKITHNGVDAHPIHFHLLNVQLINRVGWDNFSTPPEPNELGWKETVKMSPLEDVLVALRAKRPTLRQSSANGSFRAGAGFGLPNSVRRQDPSQPEGAMFGFTQIDPNTGLPAPMANMTADYGWEYTWHCHILGHEENDFMRPWKFNAREAAPLAATGLALDLVTGVLSWTDNADTEFRYTVEYSTDGALTWLSAGDLPANVTQATLTAAQLPPPQVTYQYRVTATGQAGSAVSAVLSKTNMAPPIAPAGLNFSKVTATSVTLSWTDMSATENSFDVINVATGAVVATVTRNLASRTAVNGTVTAVITGLTENTTYQYQVVAVGLGGTSTPSNTVSVTTLRLPLAPSGLVVNSETSTSITLAWNDNANNETGFNVINAATGAIVATVGTASPNTGGVVRATVRGLTANTAYSFYVVAFNATDVSKPSGTVSATTLAPVTIVNPSSLTAAATVPAARNAVALRWAALAGTTGFTIQYVSCTGGTTCVPNQAGAWRTLATTGGGARLATALTGTSSTVNVTGLTSRAAYVFRIQTTGAVAGTYRVQTTTVRVSNNGTVTVN